MYDDGEKHERKRELEFADDSGEELSDADDDNAMGVMNLDDDDDDMDDSDEDLEAGGKLAKIIAAERAIKRKLQLQKGAEDSDEEENSDDDAGDKQWGSKKNLYYNAEDVDVDFDSDDELAAEEEEEAVRMQQEHAGRLSRAEFGLDDSDEGSDDEEGDAAEPGTLGAAAEATAAVRSERVAKDLDSLTDVERFDAVTRDAPELPGLLADLGAAAAEVRGRVAPLLSELSAGGLATADGISYLEAKHMLLLTYCTNILFYTLLKLEGRSVREHPVVARLVQVKAYLDKIRPIDRRLANQVDKLVRAAEAAAKGQAAASADADDPLAYKPNPDALVSKLDEAGASDGVYRPPKLTPVAMDDPDRDAVAARERRRQKAALRRAQNNTFMRELEAELADAPEEVRDTGGFAGDTFAALKEKQRMEARAREEEELMVRVPLTKEERKRLKAQQRAGLSGRALLDDFADDVAGVLGAADDDTRAFTARTRLNQKFGADLLSERRTPASGDADLPAKASLTDRRAKYDSIKARQQAQLAALEEEAAQLKRPRVEDEFYAEAKAASQAKKQAKTDRRKGPERHAPLPDAITTEPRKITTEIEKNRGLTPHRRKDLKNPRKKGRVKFAKAEIRRKGQVVPVRPAEGQYGGEAAGIKSRVTKSVKL